MTTKFEPLQYILLDIANSAGFDKLSYEERFDKAGDILLEYQSLGMDWVMGNYRDEDPWQLRNAINAYMENDLDHVLGLDAVNQGLQLYGVLTADLATASLASVGINVRTDAYQMLADKLNENIKTNVFTRSNCKKGLMVSLYGSSQPHREVLTAMKLNDEVELAQLIGFKEQDYYDDWFEQEFNRAMIELAPKAVEAMQTLQDLNDENIGTYRWVMPDGFNVKYDVKSNVDFEFKRTTRKGTSFTFITKREIYKPSPFNRGMSPNVIHSIDGYIARQMVRRMGDKFISTIHDDFRIKAKDCAFAQNNYREILCEIMEMDLLNNIIHQINPASKGVEKSGTLTKELIMQSSYAIS